jgi:hypothetical protein
MCRISFHGLRLFLLDVTPEVGVVAIDRASGVGVGRLVEDQGKNTGG